MFKNLKYVNKYGKRSTKAVFHTGTLTKYGGLGFGYFASLFFGPVVGLAYAGLGLVFGKGIQGVAKSYAKDDKLDKEARKKRVKEYNELGVGDKLEEFLSGKGVSNVFDLDENDFGKLEDYLGRGSGVDKGSYRIKNRRKGGYDFYQRNKGGDYKRVNKGVELKKINDASGLERVLDGNSSTSVISVV